MKEFSVGFCREIYVHSHRVFRAASPEDALRQAREKLQAGQMRWKIFFTPDLDDTGDIAYSVLSNDAQRQIFLQDRIERLGTEFDPTVWKLARRPAKKKDK